MMWSACMPVFLLALAAQAQSTTAASQAAIQTLGCYAKVEPLTEYGTNVYMTPGLCQSDCTSSSPPHAVMAVTGGNTCYCGDVIPAADQATTPGRCSEPCRGFASETCGGPDAWSVFLTGVQDNVGTAGNGSSAAPVNSSAATGSPITTATATSDGASTTVTVSATGDTPASQTSSGAIAPYTSSPSTPGIQGPNMAGISLGVVVAVLSFAAGLTLV